LELFMLVYGELFSAQLENREEDYSNFTTGRIWFNTEESKIKFSNGSLNSALLANDQFCVFGKSATASQNVRLNRSGTGLLQFVTGDDTTAEGSLSSSLGKLSFSFEGYNTVDIPAIGNDGRVIFDNNTKKLKLDNGTSWETLESSTPPRENVRSYVLNESLSVGDIVYLKDNSKVSAISWLEQEQFFGQSTGISGSTNAVSICYDELNARVVMFYNASSGNALMAIVGSYADDGITWGAPVQIQAGNATAINQISSCYDRINGKIVVVCSRNGTAGYHLAYVCTVSGSSISANTAVEISGASIYTVSCCYDEFSGYVVVASHTGGVTQTVLYSGTISAGQISFGRGVGAGSGVSTAYVSVTSIGSIGQSSIVLTNVFSGSGLELVPWNITSDGVPTPSFYHNVSGTIYSFSVSKTRYKNTFLFSVRKDSEHRIYVGRIVSVSDAGYVPRIVLDLNRSITISSSVTQTRLDYDETSKTNHIIFNDGSVNFGAINFFGDDLSVSSLTDSNISTSYHIFSCMIGNRLLSIFADDDNFDAIMAYSLKNISPDRAIGIMLEDGSEDDSKNVCLFGSIFDELTGKIAGSCAYIQKDLSIGNPVSIYKIGHFISDTELMVERGW